MLDCPTELKKIAYINGVGSMNQQGFGYVKNVRL